MAPQARFGLSRCAGRQDARPLVRQTAHVLEVNRRHPSVLPRLIQRQAQEIEVLLIEEFGMTVGTGRPCHRRDRINDQPEVAFALTTRLFGELQIVHVGQQQVPAADTCVPIERWTRARAEPSIDAVETAKTLFNLKRRIRRDRVGQRLEGTRNIVRMNRAVRGPVSEFLQRPAAVVDDSAARAGDAAMPVQDRCHSRNVVEELRGSLFRRSQRFIDGVKSASRIHVSPVLSQQQSRHPTRRHDCSG